MSLRSDDVPLGRLRELDGLRGIAAVAVMLFHFTFWRDHWIVQIPWGHYGVELFFVISGFVILLTIDKSSGVVDFAISRGSRLYPAYWCAVLFTALCAVLFGSSPISGVQVAVNMTMLQQFVHVDPLDPSYWTLGIELVFYALMAIWLRSGRRGRLEWYCILWLTAACITRTALLIVHERVLGFVARPLLLYYGQFFIAGICLYRLRRGQGDLLTVATLIGACAMSAFGGGIDSLNAAGSVYLLVTIAVVALVYGACSSCLPFLRYPGPLFFGDISYPLYLIHQSAGTMLLTVGHRYLGSAVLIPTVMAIVVAIAYLIHRYAETPGRLALREWLGKLRRNSKEPAMSQN